MRKSYFIFDAETVRWMDRKGFAIFRESKRFRNLQVIARRIERYYTGSLNGFDVREAAAIENRNFEIVQFDESVINAHPVQRRKKMLDSGDPDAAIHQGRCIGNALDRTDIRAQFEIVEID